MHIILFIVFLKRYSWVDNPDATQQAIRTRCAVRVSAGSDDVRNCDEWVQVSGSPLSDTSL